MKINFPAGQMDAFSSVTIQPGHLCPLNREPQIDLPVAPPSSGENLHLSDENSQPQGNNRLSALADLANQVKPGAAEFNQQKQTSAQGASAAGAQRTTRTPQSKKKKLTVLYYGAGDCELEGFMAQNLIDMEKMGSSKDMNLLAQVDRGTDPDLDYGGQAGCARYYLNKSDNPEKINSPVLKDLGDTDSADPKVFQKFVAQGMKDYPAEKYIVLVHGHGMGATGLLPDDTSGTEMSLPGFSGALKNAENQAGVKKDQVVLGVQACKMGTAEFAYEMKDSATKLVASESCITEENSWFMDKILADKDLPDKSVDQIAEHLFKTNTAGGTDTLSLIDLKQMPELKAKVVNFIQSARQSQVPPEKLKALMEVESRFRDPNIGSNDGNFLTSDFQSLARRIAQDPEIQDQKLKKAAGDLEGTLKKAVVASSHIDKVDFKENCNGLGIMVTDCQAFKDRYAYDRTTFDRDTGWGEFTTNYAYGIKLEQVDGELSAGNQAKSQQLKDLAEFSHKAKTGLQDKNDDGVSKEIEDDHDLWCDLMEKSQPGSHKDCLNAVGSVLGCVACGPREEKRSGYRGVLEVASAFKAGEINHQTLAQGARNVLEAGKEQSPQARLAMEKKSVSLLHTLGVITNNDKMINIENYCLKEPHKALEYIAKLDEEPGKAPQP